MAGFGSYPGAGSTAPAGAPKASPYPQQGSQMVRGGQDYLGAVAAPAPRPSYGYNSATGQWNRQGGPQNVFGSAQANAATAQAQQQTHEANLATGTADYVQQPGRGSGSPNPWGPTGAMTHQINSWLLQPGGPNSAPVAQGVAPLATGPAANFTPGGVIDGRQANPYDAASNMYYSNGAWYANQGNQPAPIVNGQVGNGPYTQLLQALHGQQRS